MKLKQLLLLFIPLILISCSGGDDDWEEPAKWGFKNNTNETITVDIYITEDSYNDSNYTSVSQLQIEPGKAKGVAFECKRFYDKVCYWVYSATKKNIAGCGRDCKDGYSLDYCHVCTNGPLDDNAVEIWSSYVEHSTNPSTNKVTSNNNVDDPSVDITSSQKNNRIDMALKVTNFTEESVNVSFYDITNANLELASVNIEGTFDKSVANFQCKEGNEICMGAYTTSNSSFDGCGQDCNDTASFFDCFVCSKENNSKFFHISNN